MEELHQDPHRQLLLKTLQSAGLEASERAENTAQDASVEFTVKNGAFVLGALKGLNDEHESESGL